MSEDAGRFAERRRRALESRRGRGTRRPARDAGRRPRVPDRVRPAAARASDAADADGPSRDPVLVVPALEAPGGGDGARDRRGRARPVARRRGPVPRPRAKTCARGGSRSRDRTWSLASARARARDGRLPVRRGRARGAAAACREGRRTRSSCSARPARGADATFADVVGVSFAGRRELDVAADLDRLLREHGHDRVGLHDRRRPDPTRRRRTTSRATATIAPGDAVVMDFGGGHDGYCSDLTRTVFVGEPDEEQRRVYAAVHAAQQAAFEAVRARRGGSRTSTGRPAP